MEDENGYLSDQDIFADEDSNITLPTESRTPPHLRKPSQNLQTLKGLVSGIPPPPQKAHLNIDIEGILKAWDTNRAFHFEDSTKAENYLDSMKKCSPKKYEFKRITNKSLGIEKSPQKCKENSEPNGHSQFDIYLNLDTEEEEMLRLKIAERLIPSETSSSFIQATILTQSAKKRQRRNGWCKSPGSRLSYLAKRRSTFCQRPNLASSSNIRTISLSIDRGNAKSKERRPLKRALFQSPDKMDFATPEKNKAKRLKLSVGGDADVLNEFKINSERKNVTRNLERQFTTSRQIQLSGRSSLSSRFPN